MTAKLPTVTTPGQWRFKIVAELDDSEPELKVRFIGDAALQLVKSTAGRWWDVLLLSGSQRHGDPIGVLIGDDNRILDLGTIDREEVQEVGENPHFPNLTNVQFEGMGLPKHLSKELPRYEEMLRQLTEATSSRMFVWYVLQGSTIVHVKVLSQEQDDLLCWWMREQGQRAKSAQAVR